MRRFNSLNAAYLALLSCAIDSGHRTSPRGLPTRELNHVLITIDNPRNRLLSNSARKWNLGLAFGELAWHLSGSKDVEALAAYARIWRRYATDSEVMGSCYGFRMFSAAPGVLSQWDLCKELLRNDPQTRRALIQLYNSSENYIGSPDVSCATSLQFGLRRGRLDLTVNMRSNDAYFGFPYDVYFYANLQELMAVELGLPLGEYVHFAVSFHLYEKDLRKVDAVLDCETVGNGSDLPLLIPEERRKYCEAEASLRLKNDAHLGIEFADDFWRQKYSYLLDDPRSRSENYYRQESSA